MACFGETVLFPMLKRERKAWGDEVEHAGRWAKGVWVGRSWNSNENIVLHANDISRPRTVKRLVDEKKWRRDLIESVKVVPWGEDTAKEEDADQAEKSPEVDGVPLEEREDGPPEQAMRDEHPAIRGLYLRRDDFKRHGWTGGCAKCRFMVLHPSREGGPVHTDACKTRIVNAHRSSPRGQLALFSTT